MKVSRIRALRGPNLWSRQTAIEAIVSCGQTEYPAGGFADILDRLHERFSQIDLLQPGKYGAITMAHVLESANLGLQVADG